MQLQQLFIVRDYDTNDVIEVFLCKDTEELRKALDDAHTNEMGYTEEVYDRFLRLLDERGVKYCFPTNVDNYIY